MGKVTACHECRFNGAGDPRCITCKRVSQDDIRISKTPHAKEEMIASRITPPDEIPENCTALDEENEQKLRIAMATLFGLEPIQLLLVQHLMLRNRLSSFGDTLRKTHEQIRRYRGSERAQAGMMRNAIFRRAAFLAPVLTPLISGEENPVAAVAGGDKRLVVKVGGINAPRSNGGHDMGAHTSTPSQGVASVPRRRQSLDAIRGLIDEPSGDLFEFAGVSAPFDELKRKTRR